MNELDNLHIHCYGSIDNLRVYTRELSAKEVAAIYDGDVVEDDPLDADEVIE